MSSMNTSIAHSDGTVHTHGHQHAETRVQSGRKPAGRCRASCRAYAHCEQGLTSKELVSNAIRFKVSPVILHPLARTTPLIRQEIVDLVAAGERVAVVARRFKISRTPVY